MQYDIELIKTQEMFCKESAAASIAKYYNRNYEMMFLNVLGFDFDLEGAMNDVNKQIGPHIYSGYSDDVMFKALEKYHGISVSKNAKTLDEIAPDDLVRLVEKNYPLGLSFRHKYCDWSNKNDKTYLLITGCENDCFICLDVHEADPETKKLSFDALKTFFVDRGKVSYETYSILPHINETVTIEDFYTALSSSNYIEHNSSQQIVQFAEYVMNHLDFEVEEEGYDNWYFIPLFLNITHTLRARKLLAHTLDYIYKATGDRVANCASIEFADLYTKWKGNWAFLQKLEATKLQSSNPVFKKRIKKFAENMKKLADEENKFIQSLIDKTYVPYDVVRSEEKFTVNISDFTLQEIDIKEAFNNLAISIDEKNDSKADISGMNEYFILGDKKTITYSMGSLKKSFLYFPQEFDNVSCDNQIINISPMKCKGIIVIGCCEWKDGHDYILLNTIDGEQQKLVLDIMDWYHYSANPNCVWYTDVIDYNGEKTKRGLYGFQFIMSQEIIIKSIIFPKDKHIHIFNIFAID